MPSKKVTKKQQCMDILKYIPEPSRLEIYNISQDLKCSERTVYRALYTLRDDVRIVKEIEDLKKQLFFLYVYQLKFTFIMQQRALIEPPTSKESQGIAEIAALLKESFPERWEKEMRKFK